MTIRYSKDYDQQRMAVILGEVVSAVNAGGLGAYTLFDDFHGLGLADFPTAGDNPGTPWTAELIKTSGNPVAQRTNNIDYNGWAKISIDTTDEQQSAGIWPKGYVGVNSVDAVSNNILFQTRVAVYQITGGALTAAWGLVGGTPGEDAYAYFQIDETLAVTCHAVAGDGPGTTGIVLSPITAYTFKIDVSDITNIKFYINDVRVAADSTFSASPNMGVTLGAYIAKDSGAAHGNVYIDYMSYTQTRSAFTQD